jgi:solute carrier family 35, member E3
MPSSLQAAVAILANMFLSVTLVIVNKQIVSVYKFHFMTMLTGIHFYSSFIGCFVLFALGYMKYKPVSSYVAIFRISLASLLSIVFMNYNLAHNSVGFYQMSKLFFIPGSLLIEFVFGISNQSWSCMLVSSLTLIVVGMLLVVEGDISITWQGLVWVALGVAATSIAQVQFAPLKKELDLDAIQLLFHTAPWLTVGTFLSVPLFDSTEELLQFNLKPVTIMYILGSGLVAVAFNISNYVLLGIVSPTTYNVIGHSKTMLIITLGSYIFDTVPSRKMAVGMGITCLGAVLYSVEMNRQRAQKQQGMEQQQQQVQGGQSETDRTSSSSSSDSNKKFASSGNSSTTTTTTTGASNSSSSTTTTTSRGGREG